MLKKNSEFALNAPHIPQIGVKGPSYFFIELLIRIIRCLGKYVYDFSFIAIIRVDM
jgi:hypothetical protein